MSLRKLNGINDRAELTENKLFIVMAVAVLAVALAAYAVAYLGEKNAGAGSTSAVAAASTTTSTTLASTTTTVASTTTLAPGPEASSSTTLETAATSTTSTTSTTAPPTLPYYLAKYAGRGYRQAYIHITFLCPSCVPAVAKNLDDEQGVIAKSLSYRQKINWVIYDPGEVGLDRILQLTGANGESKIINDTEII